MGLIKGQYFINDYTELTSYCLEHYEEVKDIKGCNKTSKKFNDKCKKGSDIFIKAFQVFKILIGTVDKLIIPMELTDEVLNTQFYDKVEGYKTLQYNVTSCRLEEYVEKYKTNMNCSLILKQLHLNINTCHIYVGFTTMTYNRML